MHTLLKWIYLLALIVWMGEVIFFSFVVAPGLFRSFPPAEAGRAVGAIFPTYYIIGYVCGAILFAGSVAFLVTGSTPLAWGFSSGLTAVMLASAIYAGAIIQPRAAALRPHIHEASADQAVKDEFSHLHRQAMMLNGAVLLCGVAVSLITAAAVRP